jgi:hypothetical protein
MPFVAPCDEIEGVTVGKLNLLFDWEAGEGLNNPVVVLKEYIVSGLPYPA